MEWEGVDTVVVVVVVVMVMSLVSIMIHFPRFLVRFQFV